MADETVWVVKAVVRGSWDADVPSTGHGPPARRQAGSGGVGPLGAVRKGGGPPGHSLVPQRLDWIQPRGPLGRPDAEEQPDTTAEAHRQDHRRGRHQRIPIGDT